MEMKPTNDGLYVERVSGIGSEIKTDDPVNSPDHYTFGTIECIDYLRDKLSPEAFEGFCIGNVLKYCSRYTHKNGVEDLKKAQVYLGWAIEAAGRREAETVYSFAKYMDKICKDHVIGGRRF